MEPKYLFQNQSPYPKVYVSEKNTEYAQAMLGNIGEANSEMSAVSLYLYNSLITGEVFDEISTCFHKVMIVEMHHLNIFGSLACMLGADPRLWACMDQGMVYWTPEYNKYPGRIPALLDNAIKGEEEAILKYETQASWICDCQIAALLKRIILDEKLHLKIFRDLKKRWEANEIFCC